MEIMETENNIDEDMMNSTVRVSDESPSPVVKYRGIKAMPFIIGNETFEKLGTMGASSNLLVYLSSVFNMKSVSATTLVNVFTGTTNLAPLPGALICDSYLGRYKTLAYASISSLLGMMTITLTAAISGLHPPHCVAKDVTTCVGPTTWQLIFLLTGFGFLIIGAGGIRPCNLAFGVDQFNPKTESGKRGIDSFFNWYYFTFSFAVLVSGTLIVYVQSNVNWALGFAIPTILMFISCAFFFMGTKLYVVVKPEGNPLTSITQVFVAAIKKRGIKSPEKPEVCLFNYTLPKSINSKLPHTDQFRFLDKSAIITSGDKINPDGSSSNKWKLCSMQQVEEVKCIMRVIPIWASAILYNIAIVQQQTYLVFQALQSNRRLGKNFEVPAASYMVLMMVSLTIWIPIYDRLVVPFLRRITGKQGGITTLQRMGIGIVLSIITMLISALVEQRRRNLALTRSTLGFSQRGGAISSMSAFWLAPQLVVAGLSEAFNSIAQVEFYYKEFPENMRSFGGALNNCGLAGSSYLSGFLVSIVHHITANSGKGDWLNEDLNKGKLHYFYYMIAGLGVLNFCYFLICATWYRYKGEGEGLIEMTMNAKESDKRFV